MDEPKELETALSRLRTLISRMTPADIEAFSATPGAVEACEAVCAELSRLEESLAVEPGKLPTPETDNSDPTVE